MPTARRTSARLSRPSRSASASARAASAGSCSTASRALVTCSRETVRVCAMTSCSSRAMRLRSSAVARSASPARAARSCETRSISWRISRAPRTESVTPAIHAPQPGSGLNHSHSTANRASAAAQYTRPSRRPPINPHHAPSRHAANQPTLLGMPCPRTAIPPVATAAYTSSGRRCQASNAPAPTATTAAAAAAAALGFIRPSPMATNTVNTARATQLAHPGRNSARRAEPALPVMSRMLRPAHRRWPSPGHSSASQSCSADDDNRDRHRQRCYCH